MFAQSSLAQQLPATHAPPQQTSPMAQGCVASQAVQAPSLQTCPFEQSDWLQHVAPFKHTPPQQRPLPWQTRPSPVQAPSVHRLATQTVPDTLPAQSALLQHAPTAHVFVDDALPPVPGAQQTSPVSHVAVDPLARAHGTQTRSTSSQTRATPITALQSLFWQHRPQTESPFGTGQHLSAGPLQSGSPVQVVTGSVAGPATVGSGISGSGNTSGAGNGTMSDVSLSRGGRQPVHRTQSATATTAATRSTTWARPNDISESIAKTAL